MNQVPTRREIAAAVIRADGMCLLVTGLVTSLQVLTYAHAVPILLFQRLPGLVTGLFFLGMADSLAREMTGELDNSQEKPFLDRLDVAQFGRAVLGLLSLQWGVNYFASVGVRVLGHSLNAQGGQPPDSIPVTFMLASLIISALGFFLAFWRGIHDRVNPPRQPEV